MNFSFHIDDHKRIIHYKHIGSIRKEDIGLAWNEFLKLNEFTEQGYNLLSDYSEGRFIGTTSDVEDIIGILTPMEPFLNGKKQALVVDEPMSAALSMLFEVEIYKRIGFNVKIFSTIPSALNWLTN